MSTSFDVPRFCRRCNYNLQGLSEPHCPECGRGFDPANPKTTRRRPRRLMGRRVWLGAALLILLALVPTVYIGQYFIGWRREQATLAKVDRGHWILQGNTIGPPWLQEFLKNHGREKWLYRVEVVDAIVRDPSKEELLAIAYLKYLEDFRAGGTSIDDEVFAALAQDTRLNRLRIRGSRVDDAGVASLAHLQNLETLELLSGSITDQAAHSIAQMPGIAYLDLSDNPGITDQGAHDLAQLPKLYWLGLSETSVSDGCIDDLLRVPNLRWVSMENTRLTMEGVKRLSARRNHPIAVLRGPYPTPPIAPTPNPSKEVGR